MACSRERHLLLGVERVVGMRVATDLSPKARRAKSAGVAVLGLVVSGVSAVLEQSHVR